MGVADVVALGEAEIFAREQERHIGHSGKQLAGPGDRRRLGTVVDHDNMHPAKAGREPPQRGHAAGRDLGLIELEHDERERVSSLRPRCEHRGGDGRGIVEGDDVWADLTGGPARVEEQPQTGSPQPRDRRDLLQQEAVRALGQLAAKQHAESRSAVF